MQPQRQPAVSVRYVANAGVLVSVAGRHVLIDAPIREGIRPYLTNSADEQQKLERALPPYDAIDAILITHWHEDHFSPHAVAAHLANNPRTVLVSSPEVVGRVSGAAPDLPRARLRGMLPAPGTSELVTIGSLPIRVLRMRHNPVRRVPEQHVGFLIGESPAVLHTGDADPEADNFTVLHALPRVDVALLPYWYVLTRSSRQFVAGSIAPQRILAMHVPPNEADSVRRTLAEAGVQAELLLTPGTVR